MACTGICVLSWCLSFVRSQELMNRSWFCIDNLLPRQHKYMYSHSFLVALVGIRDGSLMTQSWEHNPIPPYATCVRQYKVVYLVLSCRSSYLAVKVVMHHCRKLSLSSGFVYVFTKYLYCTLQFTVTLFCVHFSREIPSLGTNLLVAMDRKEYAGEP